MLSHENETVTLTIKFSLNDFILMFIIVHTSLMIFNSASVNLKINLALKKFRVYVIFWFMLLAP